jgi:hypothetical protein
MVAGTVGSEERRKRDREERTGEWERTEVREEIVESSGLSLREREVFEVR